MMAEIILKLRRSTDFNAIFADRVAGVAAPQRAYDYAALHYPAAFVSLVSEEAEAQPAGANENTQRIAQIWGIVVALDATGDIRGQDPAQSIEIVRRAMFLAIYNWAPPRDAFGRRYGNLWYDGCELLAVNRAVVFWMLRFGTYFSVCGEDGEGETEEQFDPLPTFDGANIKVDWLQPFDPGVPPSLEYDPRYPPPRTYGPDGRIESEFRVDVTTPPPVPLLRRWFRINRRRS